MYSVATIDELRHRLGGWRRVGARLAFVPTMGNLHDGHLQLVNQARLRVERIVVSIFVNPLQFGLEEDFESYPRTFDEDARRLRDAGVDLLFAPKSVTLYGSDIDGHTRVEVPGLSDILCGTSRPGHFVGVATVVCKLFNLVQPDIALFGEKDLQQLMIIRRMVEDLAIPVEIVGVETQREADGLALSSRNTYLTREQRRQAPELYRTLQLAAQHLISGETDYGALERAAMQRLGHAGFKPDYVSIRSSRDLSVAGPHSRELVILAAAFLGRTRLIDNLAVVRNLS